MFTKQKQTLSIVGLMLFFLVSCEKENSSVTEAPVTYESLKTEYGLDEISKINYDDTTVNFNEGLSQKELKTLAEKLENSVELLSMEGSNTLFVSDHSLSSEEVEALDDTTVGSEKNSNHVDIQVRVFQAAGSRSHLYRKKVNLVFKRNVSITGIHDFHKLGKAFKGNVGRVGYNFANKSKFKYIDANVNVLKADRSTVIDGKQIASRGKKDCSKIIAGAFVLASDKSINAGQISVNFGFSIFEVCR